ncbi:hypothetical protein V474_01950 [Novosphingobium barchaimii LL02]|uniref:Lysozyme inhibitor LprI-like N-terminal domain-containing protein n=1 Tax=Novosphingobium barchaimii LL02 TaxID=1114963 RepID=A0A0J8A929_9SPHN|nr:lysozyme inhibitor LprI family protein [Novosphingobium barchaimii]KMS51825.1 hypothetical protein V474_01950 [Novosphingobium barchaimii LL02]
MPHVHFGAFAVFSAGLVALTSVPVSAADPERNGPSFDCSKASSGVEKAICASKPLSSLDGQIGMRYGALRKGLDKASAEKLKQDQQWFIATRNAGFADGEDRAKILLDRLHFLNAISWSTPAGVEGVWRNLAGEITVSRGANGQLSFNANAAEPSQGRWVCEAEGKLRAIGASHWKEATDDPAGQLDFTRSGVTLDVSDAEGKSSPNCGLNGSLGGSYFRTGAATSLPARK